MGKTTTKTTRQTNNKKYRAGNEDLGTGTAMDVGKGRHGTNRGTFTTTGALWECLHKFGARFLLDGVEWSFLRV